MGMKNSRKKIIVPLDGSETALGLLEILIPYTAPKVTWKCGAFTTALELEPIREYQFCYLLDKKI